MKPKKKKSSMAKLADRHELYEISVQCAEAEVDFVISTFHSLRGRKPRTMREDFCGTANVCCEWVKRSKKNSALGVDLDPGVLDWGRDRHVSKLDINARARLELIEGDVLDTKTEKVDALLAMNFSYWVFTERKLLLRYFEGAYKNLEKDGILFLDAFGGYDSFREIDEEREIDEDGKEFSYIWDQAKFNPITNHLKCHIHFSFPDGSIMRKAFTYDWRMYTLPEIKDILIDAGFSDVIIYWQGWDEDGDGDGDFYKAKNADADAGWICYLAAIK
tara:strand:- start:12361 stop:13185 length:825 start_codon:yes stop_codon:yes gene_type:complete